MHGARDMTTACAVVSGCSRQALRSTCWVSVLFGRIRKRQYSGTSVGCGGFVYYLVQAQSCSDSYNSFGGVVVPVVL